MANHRVDCKELSCGAVIRVEPKVRLCEPWVMVGKPGTRNRGQTCYLRFFDTPGEVRELLSFPAAEEATK